MKKWVFYRAFINALLVIVPTFAQSQDVFGLPEFDESDVTILQIVADDHALVESDGASFLCSVRDTALYFTLGWCRPIIGRETALAVENKMMAAEAEAAAAAVEEAAQAESGRVAKAIEEGRATLPVTLATSELLALDPAAFDLKLVNAFVLSGCIQAYPIDSPVTEASDGLFLSNLGVKQDELNRVPDELFVAISEGIDRLFVGGKVILRSSNTKIELKDCQ